MKCPQCGYSNEAGMRFCVECGQSLTEQTGIPSTDRKSGGTLIPGTILKSTYEIIRLIGEGGAGAVYEGRHVTLGNPIAVKVLFGNLARVKQIRERFVEEGRIQANLKHDNIVRVTDTVDEAGLVAIVMEFIQGETLHSFIQRNISPVAPEKGVAMILRLLSGLGLAHKNGIVHRDVKPGNIMLASSENGVIPKVCDFGIAKVVSEKRWTATGTKMGTLHYMAPEQLQDARTVDQRADLYSLGITLYELLTRRLPFESDNTYALMKAHLEVNPPSMRGFRPSLSAELDQVVLKVLNKSPDDRYPSCEDFSEALTSVPGLEALKQDLLVPFVTGYPLPSKRAVGPSKGPFEVTTPFGDLPSFSVHKHVSPPPGSDSLLKGRRPLGMPESKTPRSRQSAFQSPRRQIKWFPIFLAFLTVLLVGTFSTWWIVHRVDSNTPKEDEPSSGPLHQEDASASTDSESAGASVDAEAQELASEEAWTFETCRNLVERVTTQHPLQMPEETLAVLLVELESATEICRERFTSVSNADTFDGVWAHSQADWLDIAKHILRARLNGLPEQYCPHIFPAAQVYARALQRTHDAEESGELLDEQIYYVREIRNALFDGQVQLQMQYDDCLLGPND